MSCYCVKNVNHGFDLINFSFTGNKSTDGSCSIECNQIHEGISSCDVLFGFTKVGTMEI